MLLNSRGGSAREVTELDRVVGAVERSAALALPTHQRISHDSVSKIREGTKRFDPVERWKFVGERTIGV